MLSFGAQEALAATMNFDPSAGSLTQQCKSKLDVVINTAGVATNAADAVIYFNNSEVDILDQDLGMAGVQILPGSIYDAYAGNVVDVGAGKIVITGFSAMDTFNGTGVLASIFFQSKPGVVATSFTFEFTLGVTTDSNVADTGSNDVLTSVNSATLTFLPQVCLLDTAGPYVTNMNPGDGETDVLLDTNITFHVLDDGSGVDLGTVQAQVYDTIYFFNSLGVVWAGSSDDYSFMINPASDLPEDTEIVVIVAASDLEGNVMTPEIFTFNSPTPTPECSDGDDNDTDGEIDFPDDPGCTGPTDDSEDDVVTPDPACGNGVVEAGEECELPGTVGCTDECLVNVEDCVPQVIYEPVDNVIETVVTNEFMTGFTNTITEFSETMGFIEGATEVEGVTVADVAPEAFVCGDAKSGWTNADQDLIDYKAPKDYEIIGEPFSLACSGYHETTVNIPEEYYEVKAVKCAGGQCNDVEVTGVQSVDCGEKMDLEKTKYKANLQRIDESSLAGVFDSDRYKAEPVGYLTGRFYSVRKYQSADEIRLHSSLKLLSAATMVTRKGSAVLNAEETVKITVPYVQDSVLQDDSIAVYYYDRDLEIWRVTEGSKLLEGQLLVEVEVDFKEYADDQGEAVFAAMGVECVNCDKAEFKLQYAPVKGSEAAVIFVNGLGTGVDLWEEIIDEMQKTKQPWQAWTYSYNAEQSVAQNAHDLANNIQVHADEYGYVYLVAHGTGGLVAQKALAFAHRENFINANSYTFVKKVEKAILMGVPNDPLESQNILMTFYDYIANSGQGVMFSLTSPIAEYLLTDRVSIPRVPGVEYFVVAGNKSLENAKLLELFNKAASFGEGSENDGLVTVLSAQNVGGQLSDNQCVNYWELGANHLNLMEESSARQVVGRLISEGLSEELDEVALLGHQKFFQLADQQCRPTDRYLLIGKRIKAEYLPEEGGCACGNGYCGLDEDKVNCPIDCDNFFRAENYWMFYIPLWILILVAVGYSLKRLHRSLVLYMEEKGYMKNGKRRGRR